MLVENRSHKRIKIDRIPCLCIQYLESGYISLEGRIINESGTGIGLLLGSQMPVLTKLEIVMLGDNSSVKVVVKWCKDIVISGNKIYDIGCELTETRKQNGAPRAYANGFAEEGKFAGLKQ